MPDRTASNAQRPSPNTSGTMPDSLRAFLNDEATRLGLTCLGVTHADRDQSVEARLRAFIDAGHHGTMHWLEEKLDRRSHPQGIWPDARSAIVVGMSYSPERNPLEALADKQRGVISAYAKRRDYHDVVKKRIKQLARSFASVSGAEVKVFVDTAPLMEKPLAARAGLGWQGKHTNLVSRENGNWLYLGVILTTAIITPDNTQEDLCGSCHRCLDICPTKAFPAPYQLDARRCIAYLTIEHDGPIPHEFRTAIGNRVFGCDDCLAVCPWNKFAQTSVDQKLSVKDDIDDPQLADLLALDDASFRTRFANTPVKRTGRTKIIRNALIAAGNSADPAFKEDATRLLADPEPVVRGAAVWALRALTSASEFATLKATHLDTETDASVVVEWTDGKD